jgi:hypothetical protein
VHFPTDVFAGFALGALSLWAYLRFRAPIEAWLEALPRPAASALAAGLALVLFDRLCIRDDHHLAVGCAGFAAGAGVGTALAARRLDFDGRGAAWKRVLRFVFGAAMTLGLISAQRALGAPDDALAASLVVALDLGVLGFWLTFVMPWAFGRIGLGSSPAT